MAYNGRRQWPGQLWAARAARGREKERLGPGPGQARARAAEKERHLCWQPCPGLALAPQGLHLGIAIPDLNFQSRDSGLSNSQSRDPVGIDVVQLRLLKLPRKLRYSGRYFLTRPTSVYHRVMDLVLMCCKPYHRNILLQLLLSYCKYGVDAVDRTRANQPLTFQSHARSKITSLINRLKYTCDVTRDPSSNRQWVT